MSGNWSRIKALFAEAAEMDPVIRGSWLEERCRDNPEMGREIASLLEQDDPSDRFLETPAWQFDERSGSEFDPEEVAVYPGTTIGSWHVLREICSGGMGTVYLAERTIEGEDPAVRQRAAVKIIRARVDARFFTGRFRRERRILAQLNHPFIARFLEGGTLQNGLPYFALDYIEGERIDDYCRSRQIDSTEILKLFCKVSTAVAYAHRNLVVHRDLKPSNILITADGTPRLLDFGIAKLLADEEESINQTNGLGPCTPRYSSPEQIRGEPVTTASDIFALGIILYELVTGVHPFDPSKGGVPLATFDVLRRICEDEPKKTTNDRRKGQTCAGDLRTQARLNGDLESIIFKALQKSPPDRYKSVEYFIDDIENFLDRRPILARPQSWWYRTRTLVRRHPTAAFSASAGLLVGSIALGFILASDHVARSERDYALQQRELAASSARTMVNDLASALQSMSAPIERRLELLNRVAAVFDQIDATSRSEADPATSTAQVQAEVQTQLILARALEELGDIQGAIRRADLAQAQAKRLLSDQASDPLAQLLLAETQLEKCRALYDSGQSAKAVKIVEQALTNLRRVEGVSDLKDSQGKMEALLCDALVRKVKLSDALARPVEALALLTEAVQYGERAYQASPSNRAFFDSYVYSLENLGDFYYNSGQFNLFREPIQKAMALCRKVAAQSPIDAVLQQRSERIIARWATLLAFADSPDDKAEISSEPLSTMRRMCAADPNNVGLSEELIRELGNYGVFLMNQNDFEKAKNPLQEALNIGKKLIYEGKGSYYVKTCIQTYAFGLSHCYTRTGDLEVARKINSEFLAPLTERLKAIDQDQSNNRFREALCCYAQAEVASGDRNWKNAEQLFSRSVTSLNEPPSSRLPIRKRSLRELSGEIGRRLL